MAIQTINDALPTGDSPRKINEKINENFSNTTHAASKTVGTSKGQVPLVENTFKAAMQMGNLTAGLLLASTIDFNTAKPGDIVYVSNTAANSPFIGYQIGYSLLGHQGGDDPVQLVVTYPSIPGMASRMAFRGNTKTEWVEVYTNKNTTIGTNKEIVTSSPVVRVFSDKIEAIHEAKELPLEFVQNGTGDYTLKGTTGLRDGQNDWQIIIPKDDHDNQLIAFTLDEDTDGTIRLKTYKRTFSMETFTFGPDLDSPLDIPEGRWVDLHFKDLPQEELDVPEPEEEPAAEEDEPVEEEAVDEPEEVPEVNEEEEDPAVEEEVPVVEDPKD